MKVRHALGVGLLSAFLTPLALADNGPPYPVDIPARQSQAYGGTPDTTISSGTPLKSNPASRGKTRAEVREELIQAYRDGLIPTTEADYPPSKFTIERNKARFAEIERHFK
ncbi:DUF4148 domain-containing protein [Paraburkholderia sp. LEh10]|uniref:DUF4148 domain-containing protein n=1 Tax=Paraburkholderia sp. LEh10 TaxID=2821353 RepID=UPI001AEB0D2C|nr:DUF4148 domain-containing protein [Paraburkholderia sp. LEh10]MBP0595668.1 DUF4148 domain-containing protein [Paraburkholderia sp. LEh10]